MSVFHSDWPYLVTAAAAGGALWMVRRRPISPVSPATAGADANSLRAERPPPSARHLPVLSYEALIARTGSQSSIGKIRTRLGFTAENFSGEVEPLLQRFAEFVQLLPASESHHHAQPGGLLVHLLEVACHALHFRDAYKLPLGATTEEQSRLAALYSYAVLVGALLHDIGKPVSDVLVQLVKADGTREAWVALGGSMVEQGGAWYTVDFPAERHYDKHGRLALILLQRLVPARALTWLGQYPPVLNELTDYLSGEAAQGQLAEIIKKADGTSVADNLLTGPRTRFGAARAVPLIERLMEGLRRLLDAGELPLNRAGAAAFCDGEHLWCVAGTVAKAVREYLDKHEQRQAGAAGIPQDNSRLFDTWQEYGALIPTEAGQAIWNVKVTIGAWSQPFTVIKFALARLYASPERHPGALPAGAIVAMETASSAAPAVTAPETAPVTASVEPPSPVAAAATGTAAQINEHGMTEAEMAAALAGEAATPAELAPSMQTAAPALFPVPSTKSSHPAPAAPVADYLDEQDSAASALSPENAMTMSPAPETLSAPLAPKPKQAPRAPKLSRAAPGTPSGPTPRPNAERFLAWIQQGVADGTLPYNDASAPVHFVEAGVLIVSPRAFQMYAERFGPQIEISPTSAVREPWRVLQRDFQRSGYAAKGVGGTFIHYYTVAGPGSKQLVGYLVPDPGRFFNPVPAANPALSHPLSQPKPVKEGA
ncbi:MAG: relaxase [Pandoraea sp.]|nr:MAG: relaxase [Pandoraea sp.]TAM17744.1 MAG: relaxase [Pandoraea sp.]